MNAIEAQEIVKRFGSFTAVDHITFNVEAGEIFGFLGPNGSGKSTTIRILCGLLAPTSGRAVISGYTVGKESPKIKGIIGYMSQKFSLYEELTVQENMQFYAGVYNVPQREIPDRIAEYLQLVDLTGKENFAAGALSLGWRQRLALACALVHRPRILFLDEPTGGVDPASRREFWEIIGGLSATGTTILVTTHYMDEAEHCNRILFINAGRAVAMGTPTMLKQECGVDSLEEAFVRFAARKEAVS
jgi:ABC-2 type transport system ATP-binding protein